MSDRLRWLAKYRKCDLQGADTAVRIVELSEKGKHLTRNFWPARGLCIEGSETVCVFSVNFHNSEFS